MMFMEYCFICFYVGYRNLSASFYLEIRGFKVPINVCKACLVSRQLNGLPELPKFGKS